MIEERVAEFRLRRGGELFIAIAPISVGTGGKWGEATEPQEQYRTLDQHGELIEGRGVAGGGSRGTGTDKVSVSPDQVDRWGRHRPRWEGHVYWS